MKGHETFDCFMPFPDGSIVIDGKSEHVYTRKSVHEAIRAALATPAVEPQASAQVGVVRPKPIYATAKNTASVRSGHEMGGYLKNAVEIAEWDAKHVSTAQPQADAGVSDAEIIQLYESIYGHANMMIGLIPFARAVLALRPAASK